jgi:hypothetical protein
VATQEELRGLALAAFSTMGEQLREAHKVREGRAVEGEGEDLELQE